MSTPQDIGRSTCEVRTFLVPFCKQRGRYLYIKNSYLSHSLSLYLSFHKKTSFPCSKIRYKDIQSDYTILQVKLTSRGFKLKQRTSVKGLTRYNAFHVIRLLWLLDCARPAFKFSVADPNLKKKQGSDPRGKCRNGSGSGV